MFCLVSFIGLIVVVVQPQLHGRRSRPGALHAAAVPDARRRAARHRLGQSACSSPSPGSRRASACNGCCSSIPSGRPRCSRRARSSSRAGSAISASSARWCCCIARSAASTTPAIFAGAARCAPRRGVPAADPRRVALLLVVHGAAEVGAVSAARLADRGDGDADAGVGAAARRASSTPAASWCCALPTSISLSLPSLDDAGDRRRLHRAVRLGRHADADLDQGVARLFDHRADGLHDARMRPRRVFGGAAAHRRALALQGARVPLLGQRHRHRARLVDAEPRRQAASRAPALRDRRRAGGRVRRRPALRRTADASSPACSRSARCCCSA